VSSHVYYIRLNTPPPVDINVVSYHIHSTSSCFLLFQNAVAGLICLNIRFRTHDILHHSVVIISSSSSSSTGSTTLGGFWPHWQLSSRRLYRLLLSSIPWFPLLPGPQSRCPSTSSYDVPFFFCYRVFFSVFFVASAFLAFALRGPATCLCTLMILIRSCPSISLSRYGSATYKRNHCTYYRFISSNDTSYRFG
jgi:hypothetical protein